MVDKYYDGSWSDKINKLKENLKITDAAQAGLKELVTAKDPESVSMGQDLVRIEIAKDLKETLNGEQAECFDALTKEIIIKSHDAVVLKGYAGTGKTYLIKKVIEYINMCFPDRSIAVTAPTNKAVSVLQKGGVFNSSVTYSTLHKLLGLKESIDKNGVQSFSPVKGTTPDISKYRYLVVDEVSMLNDELFISIMELAGKQNVQVIFMGDPAQIPPINKEHSLPFLDNPFDMLKLELTEIMRQTEEHPIVDYSMIIRKNLTKESPITPLKSSIKDNKGVMLFNRLDTTSKDKFKQLLSIHYKDDKYTHNVDYVKTIAWTNKVVASLNDSIRTLLFGKDKETYNKGDKLVANSPIFRKVNGYYRVKYNTSQEFLVSDVSVITKKFSESMRNGPNVTFDPYVYEIVTNNNEHLYVIHEDSLKEYNEILAELKQMAITGRNPKLWGLYYDVVKWSDDVTYNYAITAHKSQGSTYENVFLIEGDLDKNRKIVERNRIKYTAYTRASDKLYILK